MFERLSALMKTWNQRGIYLPMVADPKTKMGSATLTMFIISFTACLVAGLIFLVTALAHLTGLFSPGDATQEAIKNASQYFLEVYIAAGSFYLGRKVMKDQKGAITLDAAPPPQSEDKNT
jgi:hypothetical protein